MQPITSSTGKTHIIDERWVPNGRLYKWTLCGIGIRDEGGNLLAKPTCKTCLKMLEINKLNEAKR